MQSNLSEQHCGIVKKHSSRGRSTRAHGSICMTAGKTSTRIAANASPVPDIKPLPVPTAASATGRQQTSANERPHGPEHIQGYCSQHTCDYRTDFNARMLAKCKLQRQESCQQELQPGKMQDPTVPHAAARAERSPAAAMQQQLVLHQAAKKDTEELYGAFLNAARETAAAESNAKQQAQDALAAEQHCLQEAEAKLKHAAEKQQQLVEELQDTQSKLRAAQMKRQQPFMQQARTEHISYHHRHEVAPS